MFSSSKPCQVVEEANGRFQLGCNLNNQGGEILKNLKKALNLKAALKVLKRLECERLSLKIIRDSKYVLSLNLQFSHINYRLHILLLIPKSV